LPGLNTATASREYRILNTKRVFLGFCRLRETLQSNAGSNHDKFIPAMPAEIRFGKPWSIAQMKRWDELTNPGPGQGGSAAWPVFRAHSRGDKNRSGFAYDVRGMPDARGAIRSVTGFVIDVPLHIACEFGFNFSAGAEAEVDGSGGKIVGTHGSYSW
jgi:hypothetical protein